MDTGITDTVEAEAISSYSHVFRRPQGACFLSLPNADTLEEDLNSHFKDEHGRPKGYDLIVVSDGEAILVSSTPWGIKRF